MCNVAAEISEERICPGPRKETPKVFVKTVGPAAIGSSEPLICGSMGFHAIYFF